MSSKRTTYDARPRAARRVRRLIMETLRGVEPKLIERDNLDGRECVTLGEAARFLCCSQGTLENWVSAKKFTAVDGYRKVGGLSRVHMPTLRARFADGSLMGK
jgi:hypothetical protein